MKLSYIDFEMITEVKTTKTKSGSALASTGASQVLFSDLRNEIESGALSNGDKLCPVRDLATLYNLSFEAVRQVLTRLETLGMVTRKQGSGTYITTDEPHAASSSSTTNNIALLMDVYGHVMRNISEELIRLMQDEGFSCVKFATDETFTNQVPESVHKAVRQWLKKPPRAVVVNWVDAELFEDLDRLRSAGSRIITLFNGPTETPHWNYVGSNINKQSSLIAKRFISRGHKRVGLVTNARNIRESDPASHKKRTVGHTPLILNLGHELRDQLGTKGALSILYNSHNIHQALDPFSQESMESTINWLNRPDRPTAIVGSDFRLIGIINAAKQMGLRIPEDIELLGIGNTPWSKAYGFDSISLNEKLIAKRIADIIALDDEAVSESAHRILVAPTLKTKDEDQ